MAIHVAILREPYLSMVLSGQKTVESRLMKSRSVPYQRVRPGERLFLKLSGGAYRGTAVAEEVTEFGDLEPDDVRRLGREWDAEVCGGADYWESKSDIRYATLIRLGQVEPLAVGPRYRVQSMRAWYVLDEAASPLREVTLTGGALRNAYLPLPAEAARMQDQPFTLVLPDGSEVTTRRSDAGPRVRWRGWAPHFEQAGVAAGDRVRLLALGDQRYAVSFHRSTAAGSMSS